MRRYEGVRPGTYKLSVGKRYERILRVAPGEGNVLVRVELRQPGTVRGELVLDHVPPEKWPARVSLHLGPTSSAGRFLRPEGGRLLETSGFATGAELVPALGTHFVIEDVDPYQPVFVVGAGGELYGRAQIEVPSGGEAVVRLRLDVTGRIALAFAQPVPVDRLGLQLRSAEAQTWDVPRHLVVSRGASSLGGTVPVLPGRYRWRVSWQAEGESPLIVEGEVEILARQTAEVAVDFERGQPIDR